MDLRAEALSPIDAATLWPQLPRLNTEIVATRAVDSLLISSGVAATGLARLPKVPRTAVLATKRGLRYRGVVVARELDGGMAWEICSLRLARDIDDDAIVCLLEGAADDVARRGGRRLFVRYPEGTPHEDAILASGVRPYMTESLFAVANRPGSLHATEFRPIARGDRPNLFRLYNRAVAQSIRQHEAATQQEWRAVHDAYDCEREYVLEGIGGIEAWVGFGAREIRMLVSPEAHEAQAKALDLVEHVATSNATLVVPEHQESIATLAERRGHPRLGNRHAAARRMVLLHPVKEGVPAKAVETLPLT